VQISYIQFMRILLSIDTKKKLSTLAKRMLSVMNAFQDRTLFIDIFHAYDLPNVKGGHVPNSLQYAIDDEKAQKIDFLAECEASIEEAIKESSNKKILVNSYLEEGSYLSKIVEQNKRYKYDLVILLPGSKDSMELLLNGSNTQKVFSKINTPILVLPKNNKMRRKDTKFIWCLDSPKMGSLTTKNRNFTKLIDLEHLEYVHFAKKEIPKNSSKVKVIQSPNPLKGLKNFDKKKDANYIYILNPKKRVGIKKYIEKSFTKGLLKEPQFPMLLF